MRGRAEGGGGRCCPLLLQLINCGAGSSFESCLMVLDRRQAQVRRQRRCSWIILLGAGVQLSSAPGEGRSVVVGRHFHNGLRNGVKVLCRPCRLEPSIQADPIRNTSRQASPCILFVESLAWPCAHPPQAPASSSFSCLLLFPSRLFSFYMRPSICPAFWCQGHSQLHTSTHANRAHNVADCKGWTDGRQSDGEEEEKEVCRTQCVDKIMISPSSPLLISAGCLLPWRRLCRGSSAICLEELPTRNSCHPLIPQTLGRIQHLPAAALCQSHLAVPTVAFASHSSRQPC